MDQGISISLTSSLTTHRMQMVFWDMRDAVLEQLYRHRVQSARIGPVLEGLDIWLGQLCTVAAPDMHPLLARALLLAAVNALLRVLLHGGPYRSKHCCLVLQGPKNVPGNRMHASRVDYR